MILTPGRLVVEYEVSLAELTLIQDLRQFDGEGSSGDRSALFERYARVLSPLNARGLLVHVGLLEVELTPGDFTITTEDHLRILFRYAAAIPDRGRLVLQETNYASSEGSARLALRHDQALVVGGDLPPAEVNSIPWRPAWQMTDGEERRSKRLDVTYQPLNSPAPVALLPPAEVVPARPSAASLPSLTRLLDQSARHGSPWWLVIALALGMIHALQPGHGKTLVAAAGLGGPNAPARGVGIALWAASCHLISVAVIAAIFWWLPVGRVPLIHLAIARVSGCAIAAVGMFRVGRHLAGLDSSHSDARSTSRSAAPGLWALGAAVGFVPCWDAVALVVMARAIGQLGWGLLMLAAFSLGLAIVLAGVGWFAGRLQNRWLPRATQSQGRRWLGFASGVILVAIGWQLLGQ